MVGADPATGQMVNQVVNLWPTVSVIAASVSAVSAMAATFLAYRTQREHYSEVQSQRLEARLQQRERYYSILVSGHAIERTNAFLEESRRILLEGTEERRSMPDAHEALHTITDHVHKVTDRWNDLYYGYRHLLLVRIDAWDDSALQSEARVQLEKLQDEIVVEIEKLCMGPEKADFDALLTIRGTAILKLIMQRHPGSRGMSP